MNDIESAGAPAPVPETPPDVSPSGGADSTAIAATQQAVPDTPLLSRLIGVLFSPGQTFKQIAARPAWTGALAVYLVAVAMTALVYSFNVDWEGLIRGQFEESLGWRLASSMLPEDNLNQIEKQAVDNVTNLGTGGMALLTTVQTLVGGAVGFHLMAILFATLMYLMGSFGDLRLGRVYLDGFICILVLMALFFVGALLQIPFGDDPRAGLPYQAGLNMLTLILYLWMFGRAVNRQPVFRRFISVYAHAMAVPAIAALLSIVVLMVQSEPVTVAANDILRSNLGALFGMKGTNAASVLLGSIDLFRIWELVVVSIGFAALSGMSFGATIAITFLPWGFLTMARFALALAFGG